MRLKKAFRIIPKKRRKKEGNKTKKLSQHSSPQYRKSFGQDRVYAKQRASRESLATAFMNVFHIH